MENSYTFGYMMGYADAAKEYKETIDKLNRIIDGLHRQMNEMYDEMAVNYR